MLDTGEDVGHRELSSLLVGMQGSSLKMLQFVPLYKNIPRL